MKHITHGLVHVYNKRWAVSVTYIEIDEAGRVTQNSAWSQAYRKKFTAKTLDKALLSALEGGGFDEGRHVLVYVSTDFVGDKDTRHKFFSECVRSTTNTTIRWIHATL